MPNPIEMVSRWIAKQPEGALITGRDLEYLAGRVQASRMLGRLAKQGWLMRVARGTYVVVTSSRYGPVPPPVEKVIGFLAKTTGSPIVRHGAAAANVLGLTTQAPVRQVYLTEGPARTLSIGKQIIEIRRAPKWMLVLGDSLAGDVVRALDWLGPDLVGEAVTKLAGRISSKDWQTVLDARDELPAWIVTAVREHALDSGCSVSSVDIDK